MLQDWESLYQEITQDYYLSKVSFVIKDRNDEKVISSIWDDIPDSIKNNLTKLNWMDIKTYADQYYVEDRKPFIAIIETSKDRYAIDIALMDENKILLYAFFNLTLDESGKFRVAKSWQSWPGRKSTKNSDWREYVDNSYFQEGIRVADLTPYVSSLHIRNLFINWMGSNPLSLDKY